MTRDEFDAAKRRAEARLRKTPCATYARYERKRDRVVIRLSTGIEVASRPRDAQGLERARPNQLDTIEISPSGLGIHFPKLDADIYLPALLEGFLGSKRWIAAEHGKLGGSASTAAKAAAARRNGKLSGRPMWSPKTTAAPPFEGRSPFIHGVYPMDAPGHDQGKGRLNSPYPKCDCAFAPAIW